MCGGVESNEGGAGPHWEIEVIGGRKRMNGGYKRKERQWEDREGEAEREGGARVFLINPIPDCHESIYNNPRLLGILSQVNNPVNRQFRSH